MVLVAFRNAGNAVFGGLDRTPDFATDRAANPGEPKLRRAGCTRRRKALARWQGVFGFWRLEGSRFGSWPRDLSLFVSECV